VATSLVAALALLAACARAGAPGSSTEPSDALASQRPVASVREFQTPPASSADVVGEVPSAVLDAILADAAGRTDVAPDEIGIMEAAQMTWPDGSLGCPEPGFMYTQALVDGYQVVLDVDGEQLDYRVGAGGSFRLCEGLPLGG
jgi:hypothetical protein